MHNKQTTNKAGFSLIELLSAIAVLMLIMVMLSMLFAESSRSWDVGTSRAENNSWGRAVLNMIAHDLQYSVACSNKVRDLDLVLSFYMAPDRYSFKSYGMENSEICFVSMQHDSTSSPRTAREFHYWVRNMKDKAGKNIPYRYEIVRGYWSGSISSNKKNKYLKHCYHNPDWHRAPKNGGNGRPTINGTLAENVAGLRFLASTRSNEVVDAFDSVDFGHELPEYVDIILDLLSEEDGIKAATLWKQSRDEAEVFVEKKMRRYTTRVYFHNKYAYKNR